MEEKLGVSSSMAILSIIKSRLSAKGSTTASARQKLKGTAYIVMLSESLIAPSFAAEQIVAEGISQWSGKFGNWSNRRFLARTGTWSLGNRYSSDPKPRFPNRQ